jgi:hypothetical protein
VTKLAIENAVHVLWRSTGPGGLSSRPVVGFETRLTRQHLCRDSEALNHSLSRDRGRPPVAPPSDPEVTR